MGFKSQNVMVCILNIKHTYKNINKYLEPLNATNLKLKWKYLVHNSNKAQICEMGNILVCDSSLIYPDI